MAAKYRIRAERADRAAQEWSRGADGEWALAEVMGPLGADGYYHLDDRRLPGSSANLDHVLLGPAGAFVIDTKNWTGQLRVDGKSLRQGDRRRDDHLERVRVQAVDVATIIEEFMGYQRVEVRPVICFVGEARLSSRAAVDRVHLFNREELVPFIRDLPPKLDQASVDELMRGLLLRLPPRTDPLPSEPIIPQLDRPPEMVVYLERWNRHGHRRLYAKAIDGSGVGYLDVTTGEVHPSADRWQPVLAQLLPHYVAAETTSALQVEKLTGEARGVLRRFVDAVRGRTNPERPQPIVVGSHWRNYGKDRLYVHRIESTGIKCDLGWYDLANGSLTSNDPTSAVIVEYCGSQYRKVATAR